MAHRCPKRKEFVARKIKEIKDSKQQSHTPASAPSPRTGTYTEVTKQSTDPRTPSPASQTHTFAAAPAQHTEEEIRLFSKLIPNMAFLMSDETEGNFLRKTNELLVINGFRRMPFIEEQLTRKDKLLTDKERERTKENLQEDKGNSRNWIILMNMATEKETRIRIKALNPQITKNPATYTTT